MSTPAWDRATTAVLVGAGLAAVCAVLLLPEPWAVGTVLAVAFVIGGFVVSHRP